MNIPTRDFNVNWKLPSEYPAPRGEKIIILTMFGVLTLGHWNDMDCVAWAPLPKMTEDVKQALQSKRKEHYKYDVR